MREISGDLHIVDYKTKMVIASLKPEDYIEDLRHWELKDNADILDIKLLDESPFQIYFQQKNLILKETLPGVITPYVITEIAKDSAAHTATVYASGEWIKLDKDAYITPQKITSKDAAYYMNFATARTVWEVGIIEAVGTRTMTIDTFTSPLRFIKEVATLFDNVEIQYRIVMNPTKPPTRYIDLVKKRGRETDKEITLGKDLLGIKRMENSENIITALVPFVMGRDADGNDKLITIESVNNGLQYIVDDAAYQRWNVDGKHLFGFYTPETDNEDMAPARLLTLAKTELKKRVDTIVSYEVDSVDISRVFGYEHEAVGEGDTIRIIDEGMTPTLYLEARAVAGDESRKDKRKNKYTFGNFVEIINPDEALRKLYQKMLTMIGDKVPKEWFGALETKLEETKKKADTAAEESQTAKDLANATKDYMDQNLVDIIESVTPPTANLKDGKTLWSDTSDPANKVLKLWKGGAWIIISPDTKPLNTALTQAQNDITKAKQDITTNKGLLDTAKSEIQGNINTEKQRITDLTTTVGKKVDKTWIDQQLLDKADKSGVYTKDYIDQNTVGKQVYETDKAGNVQKFTDMSTDITRNANAIKSKAEQSSLDTTNNNVTGVTNRVTTVEQTATGLTTRIGSAESKINTATGDISSLKTKTNTIEQTANGSAQKITELTGQFTQKTNEIINTVETNAQKLTAVETTVKNAKYGRDNLIPNSGMFSNTGGWIPNTPASSTMEIVTEDGFNVMKIKGSIRASNPITLKPDTEYVYSALIKIPVDNVVSDGSGNPLHFWSTIGATPHTAVQRAILEPTSKKVLANTWTRVSYKFRTLAGAENTLFTPFMYSTELINSNAFFYVRYFQLIEGNQITEDWQAPSGDIVKKTNEIVQTVDSTISRVSAVENRKISSNNLVKASSDKMILPPKNTGQANDNFNFAQIPVEMQMDREYTVSARITFTKGTDTKVTVYPYTNGVTTAVDIQAGGYFTHTFKKINVNTTSVLLYAGQSGATRDKGCEFTEIMITEGNAAVPYSPPSPTIDEYTQKTTAIEQTATGLRTDINSVTNRTTAVENRAGTLETKTSTLETKSNTMRSDLDGNITAINSLTETFTYAGENFLDKSSANNEFPSFLDDAYYLLNKATGGFFEDYYIVTCSDYTDAFYQIGNSSQPTNMHGFKANDSLTLSMDLQQDLVGTQTVIFQHDGTSWSEAEIKTYNHAVGVWTRVSHSFTLKANTKGFMIRIRFPRVAGANAKKLRFRKLKLEYGSLATQWNQNSVEIQSKTNMIKQTTDENSMKLTSIDASGIAGANLVYNTDLLQRPTNSYPDGWAVANTSITIWQNPWADEPRAGVFRFNRTNLADADPNNIVNAYSNKFPVARNKDYTWSVWMYVPTANWSAFKVKNAYIMEYFDNAGTRVQYQDVSLTTAEQTSLQAGNWTRITRTFRPTTAGIVTGAFRLALFHNGDIYYRMPQVELGTVATGWNRSTVDFAGNYQFNDLNTRSNEIKQTLDGTVSSVNSLSSTVGTHTTQITQQGTTISQMNNEINSRVKTTEMTDYIGKLGAENELRNTAFETKVIHATTGIITSRTPSLDKWSFTAGKVTAETTRNREGYNSAKILATGETADKYHGLNQSIPASISSGDYVFGAWFYVQDKALLDQGAVIKLQFFNGATASTTLQTELAPKLVNNGWVYAEVKITAPATTITTLRADIWVRRNGTLWVSQPMLQYGFNASAFMENPQDYVNYDALIGEVAKKVATMDYNAKITTIESSIKQTNNEINLRVLSSDVYKKTEADGRYGSKSIVDTHESSITVLKNQIISKVEAGGIASAINQTAQSVLIQAGKIYLDGFIEAKHLKAQELVGVTIKTAPSSAQRFVKLNEQDIMLYDGGLQRCYWGFYNKQDGTGIQPTLIMGRTQSGGVVGSLILTQNTPISGTTDDYTTTSASIGLVSSYNSNSNVFLRGSEVSFYQNGTLALRSNNNLTLTASQQGYIWLKTDSVGINTDIYIEPSKDFKVTAGNNTVINSKGYFDSTSESGRHYFGKKDKPSTQNHMQLYDNNLDADLSLGFLVLRASHVTGYTSGFQIKNANGTAFRDLEARNIKCVSLQQTSTRLIKTGIKDIEISSLEKIMGLKTQQYYFKSDMDKLYKIREDRVEGDPLPTIADIPLQYGFIAEDSDIVFTTDDKTAINLYPVVALTVDSVQHIKLTQDGHDTRITQLEVELEAQKRREVTQDERIAALEELVQKMINGAPTTENTTQTEQP
ncbi:phage tail spike protein [Bacillus sp. FSL M7-1431]|uniref:phage tail spike protein n=1 Tax=Bacillus sp. FSL M7-1431 TaxID=2978219 RepID=UPI0030FA547D